MEGNSVETCIAPPYDMIMMMYKSVHGLAFAYLSEQHASFGLEG